MTSYEVLVWAVDGAYYTWQMKRELLDKHPSSRVLQMEEKEVWDKYQELVSKLKEERKHTFDTNFALKNKMDQ